MVESLHVPSALTVTDYLTSYLSLPSEPQPCGGLALHVISSKIPTLPGAIPTLLPAT